MSLFEPDILNGAAAPRGARNRVTPERRLMAAILTDAIECFQKNLAAPGRKRRRLFREAEEWIGSEDAGWVFSFRNICDVLGVDAQALREQAAAWKRHPREPVTAQGRIGMAR